MLSKMLSIFFGISLFLSPYASSSEDFGNPDKVICVSIPKCGTHLLIKCITLMDVEGVKYNYNTEDLRDNRKQTTYHAITLQEYADKVFSRVSYRINKNKDLRRSFLMHLPFTAKYKPFFDQYTVANFLMIRDPRDQLISLATTSLKDPKIREEDSLREILLDLLEGTQRRLSWTPRHGACDLIWSIGFVEFYRAFLKWTKEPNFYVVRFENLIGPQGGGTEATQIQEIQNIAHHLGITLSPDRLTYVKNHLFGETRTFKEGQTKGWKKYFTPQIKKAFKKVPGACQLLIDLGYEKDNNW